MNNVSNGSSGNSESGDTPSLGDTLSHTIVATWREDNQGEVFQGVSEFRATEGEVEALLASLRDPALTIVTFPRRKGAGQAGVAPEVEGFFAVGKRSLITCQARRETEEAWAARHAPPKPEKNYPHSIAGERDRLIDEEAGSRRPEVQKWPRI